MHDDYRTRAITDDEGARRDQNESATRDQPDELDDPAARADDEDAVDLTPADRWDDAVGEQPRPASPGRSGIVIGILSGLLVVAIAAAVTFAILWLKENEAAGGEASLDAVGTFMDARAPDVETTTRQVVDLMLNYDSTNIEDRTAEVLEYATGNFKDDYGKLMVDQGLQDAIIEVKASSRATVIEGPTVSFLSPSEAFATLRTSVVTQTKNNPSGQSVQYVMALTLVDVEGEGWRVDEVELLSEAIEPELGGGEGGLEDLGELEPSP